MCLIGTFLPLSAIWVKSFRLMDVWQTGPAVAYLTISEDGTDSFKFSEKLGYGRNTNRLIN